MYSPYKSKKGQLEQLEKEFKYARWFWKPADSSSWLATKIIVTLFVSFLLGVIGYIASSSILYNPLAALVGVGILIAALVISNTNIRDYMIRIMLKRRKYEQVQLIDSYSQLKYYFLNGHDEILFIENGRDLTGIGLFKLKAIPLVIKGNFERFIRTLYQQQIPVYWNYTQSPIEQGSIIDSPAISDEAREFYEDQPQYELESRIESRNGMWVVRLIFGTRRCVPVTLNIESSRLILYQELKADLIKISTAFQSAYPHTILELLRGKELEKAFSITITGGGIPAFF